MRPISVAISVHLQRVAIRNREHVHAVPASRVPLHRGAHRRFGELRRLVERELLAESLFEDAVGDWRAAPRGHEVLRSDRPAHVAREYVRSLMVHACDDELHVERVVALHRGVDNVRDQFRTLFDGQGVAATQREEPAFGFREVHEVLRIRHGAGDRYGSRTIEGEDLLDHLGSNEETLRGALVCGRSEEHTSELQSHLNLVCRLLLEKKKKNTKPFFTQKKKKKKNKKKY